MDINELATKAFQYRKPTPDLVADILREAILRGLIQAGEPLRQEELAVRFGVSRMPVREAIRQLEAEGLVQSYPNRGAVVATLSHQEAQEIYEIRVALETTALRLSIPKLGQAEFEKATQLLAETDREEDVTRWGELNWEFHSTLYTPANRPRLLGLIKNFHTQVDRYMRMELSVMHYKSRSQDEHRLLTEACRAQEVEKAVALLEEHIKAAGELLVDYLQKQEQERDKG